MPLTRRAFIQKVGVGAAGMCVSGTPFLAACSKSPSPLREVRVLNEPLAIDDSTPDLFESATGVFLRYDEYTDPVAYLTERATALQAHRDIDADVVVLPDHQTAQTIEAGWVRPLPVSAGRRGEVLLPFANPRFDPGRRFSLPWTATVVGLAYDRRRVREPIRSAGALFDRRFKGRVVLSADLDATLGLLTLASGQDPAAVTEARVAAAVDRIREEVGAGQVRSFATTEYVDDLVSGRALLAIARADEIRDARQTAPSLTFVVPTEGGLLQSTNMVVPVGARNVDEAGDFIDFMFSADPISRLASFSGRVMPVVGGIESLRNIDVQAAADHLVEPDPTEWSRLSVWGGSPESRAASELAELVASLGDRSNG